MNGVIKIAKKRALTAPMKEAKMYKALLSDLGKVGYNVGVGFTQGAVAEGGAETIQEAMTIAQRLSIDPEYDREQAKMDLLEASFKGIVGGGIFAGGGRGVTSSVERVVNRSRDLIAGKEEKKQRKRSNRGSEDGTITALSLREQHSPCQTSTRTLARQRSGRDPWTSSWASSERRPCRRSAGFPCASSSGR